MKKIAMIQCNVVINVALWDGVSTWDVDNTIIQVDVTDMDCGVGWTYASGIFYKPIIVASVEAYKDLVEYASNEAAIEGGLQIGDSYRTEEYVRVVY